MSQNKTVFPGIGAEGDYIPNSTQSYSRGQAYSHSDHNSRIKGTVYPGMGMPVNDTSRVPNPEPHTHPRPTGKPIVGFLYSISRTGVGEYWPLHIGQNLIGNSPECDIMLGEGTVSFKHANLHINKMKKPEKTEATISDLGSTNGTLVNENSVSVARPIECMNGDIITIGENYDLLLMLIDTKAMGLHVSENFIDVREETDNSFASGSFHVNSKDNTTKIEDFPPKFNGPDSSYNGAYRPKDSTIGLDDTGSGYNSGGTIGMD